MRYLVTGGCGFVGSNVAAKALSMGGDVLVCDNLSGPGSRPNLEWLRSKGLARFEEIDMRKDAAVASLIRSYQPDAILHLAGQIAMTTSVNHPRLDFETNVLGSINLLEAVRQFAPEAAVVFASSNKVYGDLPQVTLVEEEFRFTAPEYPHGIDESAPLNFQTPYGCSKGAADQYMLDYARTYQLNTVVFRHSSIYGPRQFATYNQGWVGWFCDQAIGFQRESGRAPFTISGNGKQVRDLLFVDDAVAAYFAAVASVEKIRGEVFNMGGGTENSSSLLELFQQLESLAGVRLCYEEIDWRLGDQRYFVANNGKAARLLGWRPEVSKESGVRRMFEWASQMRE